MRRLVSPAFARYSRDVTGGIGAGELVVPKKELAHAG